MRSKPQKFLAIFLIFAAFLIQGCGIYFKTYRYESDTPFQVGMSEQDVLNQWGSPLSVQVMGPQQVWKYFAQEPEYGKSKQYSLVWFQDGKVVKWQVTEDEKQPLEPAV